MQYECLFQHQVLQLQVGQIELAGWNILDWLELFHSHTHLLLRVLLVKNVMLI